ncbi:site-specific integrase [Larkinella ripae]
MANRATVNLFLDNRSSQDKGKGTVKWSVCYQRKQRLYTTGVKVNSEEWEFLQKNRGGLKGHTKDEARRQLWIQLYGDQYIDRDGKKYVSFLKRAQNVVDHLGDAFTFDAFKDAIENYGKTDQQTKDRNDVLLALLEKKEQMVAQERIGNGSNYGVVAASLLRFVKSLSTKDRQKFGLEPLNKKDDTIKIRFDHITPEFLSFYERWMLQFGKRSQKKGSLPSPASSTTVGIYCRHLRSVFNDALRDEIIDKKKYPFGRGRFIIPAGRKPKKALSRDVIELIKSYQPENEYEQQAHSLWVFTYLSGGLNMADICHLKWRDVDVPKNSFSFFRTKTKLTKKGDKKPIKVDIHEVAWSIIRRYGTPLDNPENYVFPFLSRDLSAEKQKAVIAQLVKTTNKWMRRIAAKLNISDDLVTYAARHSYATTLLRSGAPLKFISSRLGHGSTQTTEAYLGDFEESDIQQFLEAL